MTDSGMTILISLGVLVAVVLVLYLALWFRWSMFRIDHMRGESFERFLKKIFEKLGYRCSLTKKTGDQGIDLILKKGFAKIGIQAKRYRGKVGNAAVQEAAASRKYYGLSSVKVVTNSHFTKSAKELAKANRVELIDREELKKLIRKARRLSAK